MCKKLVRALERIADSLETKSQLDRMEKMLEKLIRMETKDMARDQQIIDLITQLNENTNEQAVEVGRIRELVQQAVTQLKEGTTPEGTTAVINQLTEALTAQQAVEDNLKALGADPENPIPVPES